MNRDDAGGVAGDPNEHPEDNEEPETSGLEPGAAMVPPPHDVGSRSARAEQAKSVHGATGELAEDDGLLQANEADRAGVERLAEAMRDEDEGGRRRQERREDDLDEERWASGENLHEFEGEQASG
jgi:hypothetical protein